MPRDGFTLFCTDCKMENYISKKNKKNTPEKVELKNSVQDAMLALFTKKRNNLFI